MTPFIRIPKTLAEFIITVEKVGDRLVITFDPTPFIVLELIIVFLIVLYSTYITPPPKKKTPSNGSESERAANAAGEKAMQDSAKMV